MRSDAVVLAVRGGKAVVLAPESRFILMKDQNYFVGQRIALGSGQAVHSAKLLQRTLLIAACFVMLFTSSALAVTKYVPWTEVYLETEAGSICYQLNARNEVLSSSADTNESQTLVDTMAAEAYEPIGNVMERTLNALEEQNEPITVSIAARFGGIDAAEAAVTEAGLKTDTPVTVQHRDWNDRGNEKPPAEKPGGFPGLVQPEEIREQQPMQPEEIREQQPMQPEEMGNAVPDMTVPAVPIQENVETPEEGRTPEQTETDALSPRSLDPQQAIQPDPSVSEQMPQPEQQEKPDVEMSAQRPEQREMNMEQPEEILPVQQQPENLISEQTFKSEPISPENPGHPEQPQENMHPRDNNGAVPPTHF